LLITVVYTLQRKFRFSNKGNTSLWQILGAIRQTVQRVPNYAESHSIEGLLCEAHSDYNSAIAAYRHAKFALAMASYSDSDVFKSRLAYVSVNLARSLCKVNVVKN
jgi:superkiller protein 3